MTQQDLAEMYRQHAEGSAPLRQGPTMPKRKTMTDPYETPYEPTDELTTALFEGWSQGEVHDLATHSADDGWPGLTYTSDIVELYHDHTAALWAHAREVADEMGVSVAELQSWSKNPSEIDDESSLATWLVWLAAETLAREIDDES